MSFRDFKEEIFLVLQIKGGQGFSFATSPLLVTANLGGNIHESFVTEPSPQPKFENEFVWVMDKTRMKSIWSDKIPVRVECLAVTQSRRSRIGYTILNTKDAQVIHNESMITEKQVRLLGLSKEVSLLKPELILSFYITDIPIQSPKLTPQFSPPLQEKILQMSNGIPKVTLGVGREHFKLSINVIAINNLEQLMPSNSEIEPELLRFSYSLLGAEVVSDVSTNHSVQLALTSSLACLKTYFIREPLIPISLYMGSLLVGQTTLNMENLMLSEDVAQRRARQPGSRKMSCRCEVTPLHNVAAVQPDPKSCLDFSVSLVCNTAVATKKQISPGPSLTSIGAGGDADNSQIALPLQTPVTLPLLPQTPRPVVVEGGETYRTQPTIVSQTLGVTVASLHLDQPLVNNSWLRLSSGCGSVCPQHEVIVKQPWSPLEWQLTVTLPRRLLECTLASQPVTLQMGVTDQLIASAVLLPPANLSTQTTPCEYAALIKEGEKIGEVGVTWSLADTSSQSASTLTDTSLSSPTKSPSKTVVQEVLSPRARELKILSFVEELEDWAEKQRIIVMEGLKEEEAARLASLQAEWEAEVGGQVCQGRQLLEALHNMKEQLSHQESQLRENQLKLKVYKEELERVHRSKLQEFKDLSRRMQDEFNHKLALIASDKVALEKEVQELREENTEVRRTLRELESSSDADKRLVDSLTHELKLLKEKLSVEQDSKTFFKEHCRKAEQEIHRLNLLRQEEQEARLLSEKNNLEKLACQQIIVERNDMRQDQRLLEEIRHQLLTRHSHMDINSNSNGDITYTDGLAPTEDRHIRRAT